MKRNVEDIFWEVRKPRKTTNDPVFRPADLRIHSVELWKPATCSKCYLSVVSSSSSGISKVSQSLDSVSAVSSSDFTANSLEEGEIDEKKPVVDTHKGGISNKFGGVGSNIHKSNADNVFDLETHLVACRRNVKRIGFLVRFLDKIGASESLHKKGMNILKGCHQSLCFLASIYTLLLRLNKDSSVLRQITECFKDHFNVLMSLHTRILNINGHNGLKWVTGFSPYNIDMLLTMLEMLIPCFRESKNREIFTAQFHVLVHSTLLRCCSVADSTEDDVKVASIKALFRLLRMLLPVDQILVEQAGNGSLVDTDEHNRRSYLFSRIYSEYIRDEEFKSLSLILLQLQSTLGIQRLSLGLAGGTSESIRKLAYSIAHTAVLVGCTKRQFPVGYLHYSHYSPADIVRAFDDLKRRSSYTNPITDDLNGSDGIRLWHKARYWLLQLLEDSNTHAKNMALKIIRHVLVTLLLAEKDRQHIMSLVTDCVSDDSTFKGAMEVVVAVSHLYPLKDGAVRRISNLTLKGCGTRNRIEIMRLLGYCHFTKKGEEAVINILQNLCDPISTDEQKNAIVQCATSFVTNNDTEVLFSHVEWPEILATLANLQKNRGCTEFTNLTMAAYSKNSYSSAPHWIGMLWGYLLKQKTSENFMAAAWRSEAAMRFPDLVNIKSKPLEIDSAVDAKKVFAEFLGFSKHDVKVECLKGKTTFMYIHRLRVRGRSAMVHKITDSCQTDVKVEPYSDTGKRCNCVDCATDKMVMSSKSRRTIDNLYDNTLCSAYAVKHWSGYESAPFENLNENSAAEKFGGEAVFGYYRKLAGFRAEKYEVVNDVNCVKFPSHLGTTLTCCMKACSVPRKVTPFNIRSPTVTGFLERKERLCLTFKGKYMDDFTTPTKLHVTHPTPTVYPVPLKITQSDFGEVNTVSYKKLHLIVYRFEAARRPFGFSPNVYQGELGLGGGPRSKGTACIRVYLRYRCTLIVYALLKT